LPQGSFFPLTLGLIFAALLSAQSVSALAENVPLFLTLSFAMFIASVRTWRACEKQTGQVDPNALKKLMLLATLLHAIALFGAPMFEDDFYRYLWDGYMSLRTGSPYGVAPEQFFSDPSVPLTMRHALDGINNPEIPTIYGPSAQWLFALSQAIQLGNEWVWRALLSGVHLLLLWRVLKISTQPWRWSLYLLNPLVFKEVMLTGHFDFLLGFSVLLCLQMLRAGRLVRAGVWLALATGSKLNAFVMLAFLLRRPLVWIATILSLLLLYLPFVWRRGEASDLLGFSVFAQSWQFNAGLFELLQFALGAVPTRVILLVLGMFLGIALMIYSGAARKAGLAPDVLKIAQSWMAISCFILLCGPVHNPWYWLWIFPVAIFCAEQKPSSSDRWLAALFGAGSLSLLSYMHGLYWQSSLLEPYQISILTLSLEHCAIWLLLGYVCYALIFRRVANIAS
jgi:alpha-1,6-mannosyltransferase